MRAKFESSCVIFIFREYEREKEREIQSTISRRRTMMKCSLLNSSNRRRTSFFYSCRSFTLISFYFHTPFRFCPSSLDFRPFYSRLCTTLSLCPPSFFIHQVFNETDIWQRRIIANSCVIIVSNVHIIFIVTICDFFLISIKQKDIPFLKY